MHVPGANNRLWSLWRLPQAAKKAGARLVHTQYFVSPFFSCPVVTTVHDVSFLIDPSWFRPKDRALLSATINGSSRRATRIITVSETSKRDIERLLPVSRGKVAWAHLAADPALRPTSRELARERATEILGFSLPYILTVGTRWPRKNMELAVDASSRLPQDIPHRLVVTGKAGWGDQALGMRGHSTGYLDVRDLAAIYCAADLYLAPSHYEGFGIPLVEAFVCGCPVLCSAGGSLPEVAGNAGLVERSWDAADWAKTITRLLSDSSTLEGMRERGFVRAQEFSWQQTALKTLQVYRDALQ